MDFQFSDIRLSETTATSAPPTVDTKYQPYKILKSSDIPDYMPVIGQDGHRIRISKFPEFSKFSRVFLTIFQAKFIHLFL